MSLAAARNHLTKARQFLSAAELNFDAEFYDAATSNAVTAGINAKDAICIRRTGRTGKTENHAEAERELAAALGKEKKNLPATLKRLLSAKTKAQYQEIALTASASRAAVGQATTLVDEADRICST